MNTFRHGIHPDGNKARTKDTAISVLPPPPTLAVPLRQHLGKDALPIVQKGEYVRVGQCIGKADGYISAPVFSSVSGNVTDIKSMPTPTGSCLHVCVQNDGKYDEVTLPPLVDPTAEEIVARIEACGIVGMGGAGFPTAVKLRPKERIDTLLINAAECEPYLTCDYRLMRERAAEVLRGAMYMARALALSSFTVGIEDNKTDAAQVLTQTAQELSLPAKIVLCRTKYPQGAEKQLIYAVTRRKVPAGKLPASVGVIVDNVHTAFCVCEAVEKGKKCYERVLTVSGGGAATAGNFLVRTGTSAAYVLEHCGGIGENTVKLLSGGPMMGVACHSADFAVTKTTSALLLLTESEAPRVDPQACINCASCVRACPMRLMPVYIDACIRSDDTEGAQKYGALHCIECGCCAFVCPAHRPLVQSIRLAKKKIRALSAGKGGK